MQSIILIVHIVVALAIVGLVLLQQGKGADAGASFGSGASQTVFGASGTGNFLTRATTIAATIFFVTSLSLAIFARDNAGVSSTAGLPSAGLPAETGLPQSDLPQLDETPQTQPDDDGVPTLPDGNN